MSALTFRWTTSGIVLSHLEGFSLTAVSSCGWRIAEATVADTPPNALGATLVIIYRVLSPRTVPLNAIVLLRRSPCPKQRGKTMSQTNEGFYQPASSNPEISAKLTHIVGNGQPNKFQQVIFKRNPLDACKYCSLSLAV